MIWYETVLQNEFRFWIFLYLSAPIMVLFYEMRNKNFMDVMLYQCHLTSYVKMNVIFYFFVPFHFHDSAIQIEVRDLTFLRQWRLKDVTLQIKTLRFSASTTKYTPNTAFSKKLSKFSFFLSFLLIGSKLGWRLGNDNKSFFVNVRQVWVSSSFV